MISDHKAYLGGLHFAPFLKTVLITFCLGICNNSVKNTLYETFTEGGGFVIDQWRVMDFLDFLMEFLNA